MAGRPVMAIFWGSSFLHLIIAWIGSKRIIQNPMAHHNFRLCVIHHTYASTLFAIDCIFIYLFIHLLVKGRSPGTDFDFHCGHGCNLQCIYWYGCQIKVALDIYLRQMNDLVFCLHSSYHPSFQFNSQLICLYGCQYWPLLLSHLLNFHHHNWVRNVFLWTFVLAFYVALFNMSQ